MEGGTIVSSEHSSDIPVKEITELLDAVGQKVPKLISDLLGTLFSEQAGTQLGKSVGLFYRELVNNGIPEAEALAMAKAYMSSLANALSSIGVHGGSKHEHGEDKEGCC